MDEKTRKRVLLEIKPTASEIKNLKAVSEALIKILESSRDKLKIKCDFFIGGSFGKDTFIKNKSDIDVFCRFDLDYEDNSLSPMLEELLKDSKVKFKKLKGSRDYFLISHGSLLKKFKFEIVPIYKIKKIEDAKNSTDVSPLHVDFLRKKIEKDDRLADEIRIAKQFLKAKGLYGSESYISGFSGHSVDILISYYGSLNKFLEDGTKWGSSKYIDITKSYRDELDIKKNLSEDKHSNLIIIDPIIKHRNAARALGEEKYFKFLFVVNTIDKLSIEDFKVQNESPGNFINKYKKIARTQNLKYIFIKIRISPEEESEDIIGSKLLKLFNRLRKIFEEKDFVIHYDDFYINMDKKNCVFAYLPQKQKLSTHKKIYGPKVTLKEALWKFSEDKREVSVDREGRSFYFQKRDDIEIEDLLDYSKDDFEKILGKKMKFIKTFEIDF